jgi:LEA14-like dessication related protein
MMRGVRGAGSAARKGNPMLDRHSLSRRTISAVLPFAVAIAAMFAAGCSQFGSFIEKPSVGVKGVKIENIDLKGLTLLFDLEVKNPYRAALPLVGVAYRLESDGRSLVQGDAPMEGSVPAHGSRIIGVPAKIRFADVLKIAQNIHPGSVIPYDATLELAAQVPHSEPVKFPIHKKGEFPIPAIPKVELRNIRWDNLSLREVAGTVNFYLENTNDFPVDIKGLHYALSLGGSEVGNVGLMSGAKLGKGEGAELAMPVRFSTLDLGAAFLNILQGEKAAYAIDGAMDVGTPFGKIRMPFARNGKAKMSK